MDKNKSKRLHRISRHKRTRAKIFGTADRPRVSVFKSNQHIFVQLIDDVKKKTILGGGVGGKAKSKTKINKTDTAKKIGELLAEKAKAAGIKEVIFDKGGFKFHGRVKAVAEGLKAGGIKL